MAVLSLALGVVLFAGVLVFVESSASPAPAQVLASARRFVASARSVSYAEAVTISAPVGGGGDQLLRSRTVSGVTALHQATDFSVIEAANRVEYRRVAPDTGVWVRAATGAAGLAAAQWIHAPGYDAFETAVLTGRAGPSGTANPAEVAQASLADAVASGEIVAMLVSAGRHPARHGTAVRTLDVGLDPDTVLGARGSSVDAISAQVTVDTHGRPAELVLHVRASPSTIEARYELTWNAPVSIPAPDPADVVAAI